MRAPDPILAGLDPAQQAAVVEPAGRLLVVAGPGSGKTRVLTRRVALRNRDGIEDPRRTLVLTFTRRAANELRQRLAQLGVPRTAASTFHGAALVQLRSRALDQHRTPPRLISSPRRLLARIVTRDELGRLDELIENLTWARRRSLGVTETVSAQSTLVSVDRLSQILTELDRAKRRANLIELDDLVPRWREALMDDPAFGDAQRWRFRHLYVDETQDLDGAQLALLHALVGPDTDLSAVGDPDQSIYGWNGAVPHVFERLAELAPGAVRHTLTVNHRSHPRIVAAATEALGRPPPSTADPQPASLFETDTTAPDRAEARQSETLVTPVVRLVEVSRVEGEAAAVARWAIEHQTRGRSAGELAVLARTNALLDPVHEALRSAGLDSRRRGGASQRLIEELLRLDGAALRRRLDDEDPHLVALRREMLDLGTRPSVELLRAWLTLYRRDLDEPEAIELATFHGAKGAEWPLVWVIGAEDGTVPLARADDLDEERRLLYVAMTRAEEHLTLSWCRERGPVSPWLSHLSSSPDDASGSGISVPDASWRRTIIDSRRLLGQQGAVADRRSALLRWRHQLGRGALLDPRLVLSDEALELLARAGAPADDTLVAEITGWGRSRLDRFGPSLRRALDDTSADT